MELGSMELSLPTDFLQFIQTKSYWSIFVLLVKKLHKWKQITQKGFTNKQSKEICFVYIDL